MSESPSFEVLLHQIVEEAVARGVARALAEREESSDADRLLGPAEVADLAGVSVSAARALLRSKLAHLAVELPSTGKGVRQQRRIARGDFLRWLKERDRQ